MSKQEIGSRTDLQSLEAGPELDRLIAEKVMGWVVESDTPRLSAMHGHKAFFDGFVYWWANDDGYSKRLWRPSTSIADAWEVVEVLKKKWLRVELASGPGYDVCILVKDHDTVAEYQISEGEAETMPLAICRAALLAIDSNQEDSAVGGTTSAQREGRE